MKNNMTYEQWLELSNDERRNLMRDWNTYERENIGFPYIAAGRFALESSIKILDMRVGVYHGGEYVLEFCVQDDKLRVLAPRLASEFDGFRIIFIGISNFYPSA